MNITAEHDIFSTPLSSIDLPEMLTVDEKLKLVDVLHQLQNNKIGAIGIKSNDELVGIFSERDFLIRIVNQVDGWKEKSIADYMTKKPMTLKADSTLREAIVMMIRRDFRHIPIFFSEQKIWKIISAKDVLKNLILHFPEQLKKYGTKTEWNVMELDALGENFSFVDEEENQVLNENSFLIPLRKAVFRDPLIVDENDPLDIVLAALQEKRQASAIVTKYKTEVVGIITERDFLFKIFDKIENLDQVKVCELMTKKPHTLLSRHFICYAINNMFKFNYRNLVIVNEDRIPVATVTLMDILKILTWNLISNS